jgi:3-hydroxyisobutyrate dehydrogenase-like beta-hydroxyacid dehydrogenase
MSDITVMGLGQMGSAIAKTMLSTGYQVTVWNRSQDKADQLVSSGAILAATVVNAIEASPVILVCVSNYATTRNIFESDEDLSVLSNRIVVQLSSGTPQEAIGDESWFVDKGANYLDGAILGSPKIIGTKEGQILVSGNADAWKVSQSVLGCLAGNFQYVGNKIDSAKILDLAWLSQRLGLFMGVFQGLLLCKAGGVSSDVFGSTIAVDQRVSMMANTIHNETYLDPINTVKVWKEALHHIQIQARDTGANNEVLEFIADKFQRAQAEGFEEQDLAALIKIFR